MAKIKYKPSASDSERPLGQPQESNSRTGRLRRNLIRARRGCPQWQNQTRSAEVSEAEQKPAQPEGIRLSSAPVKPLSSTLKPSRNTVYLYPEDLTKL